MNAPSSVAASGLAAFFVFFGAAVARADASDAGSASVPAEGRPLFLPIDCTWLQIDAAAKCPPTHPALAALSHARELLRSSDQGCADDGQEVISRAQRLLEDASALDPAELSVPERIVSQNLALLLGIRALHRQVEPPFRPANVVSFHDTVGTPFHPKTQRCLKAFKPVASAAARLVARLALPASAIEQLGETRMPGVEERIGPESEWVEKSTATPLVHDAAFYGTKLFRPVRSGNVRAIFSQFVAVDTSWQPHLTPLVDTLEVRRGLHSSSPACALVVGVERLACPPAAWFRPMLSSGAEDGFVFSIKPGTVACNTCHGPGLDSADLPPADRDATLRKRRKSGLDLLRQELESMAAASR